MGFILNPLYNLVSGIIVLFHNLLSPLFGKDSGVTWSLSIMGLVVIIRIVLIPLFVVRVLKSAPGYTDELSQLITSLLSRSQKNVIR